MCSHAGTTGQLEVADPVTGSAAVHAERLGCYQTGRPYVPRWESRVSPRWSLVVTMGVTLHFGDSESFSRFAMTSARTSRNWRNRNLPLFEIFHYLRRGDDQIAELSHRR
jgi:hypothetical protein